MTNIHTINIIEINFILAEWVVSTALCSLYPDREVQAPEYETNGHFHFHKHLKAQSLKMTPMFSTQISYNVFLLFPISGRMKRHPVCCISQIPELSVIPFSFMICVSCSFYIFYIYKCIESSLGTNNYLS